jgi:hypothetical protein
LEHLGSADKEEAEFPSLEDTHPFSRANCLPRGYSLLPPFPGLTSKKDIASFLPLSPGLTSQEDICSRPTKENVMNARGEFVYSMLRLIKPKNITTISTMQTIV